MPTRPLHDPDSVAHADVRTGRHRRGKSGLVRRHARPGRFATVWPCAQDDRPHGTGTLAGWLLNAVIKIVTTYSMPGNRVLLLTPSPAVQQSPRRPGAYRGLFEATWSVIQLGRGVQTGLVGPPQESGPVTGYPTGLFDVIIAAADPHDLAGMCPTSWSGLLTPRGVLGIITHGDNTGPRYFDPTVTLIAMARPDGLRYLDHIVAMRIPVHDTDPEPLTPGVQVRAHADLHVFAARTRE